MHSNPVGIVAEFIGPLLVGIGLIAGAVGWGIKRTGEKIRTEITNASTVLDQRLTSTVEIFQNRFADQQRQLEDVKRNQESATVQLTATSLTVAEIKGKLNHSNDPNVV